MSTQATELGTAYHRAAAALIDSMEQAADAIARDFQEDRVRVLAVLAGIVNTRYAPAKPTAMDARTQNWRCRFRIYDTRQMDEPVADSDEELEPGADGTMVLCGLPAVASESYALAQAFHGTAMLTGMGSVELEKHVRGVRPTLSRNKGRGVMRIPYDTFETFNEQNQKRGWLMRVDIIREETKL